METMKNKKIGFYHIVWGKYEEIVDVEMITNNKLTAITIISIKNPQVLDRVGSRWDLNLKAFNGILTKVTKESNPEYWL